jgi:HK97 family phage major capsid protein
LKNYAKDRKSVNLELKTVGNMVAGNLTTSGTISFAGANQVGGVGRKPYESVHVRNIPGINIVPTSSDQVYVIRDNAGEGAPTAVGMGVVKPQSDRDYSKLIVPVTKIAHYFKIPEEMLADNAWLQNEITAIGVEDLMAVEDNLLLNQASGAGLFAGLTTSTNSTAFSAPTALALGVNLANRYDVLVAAWTQLRTLNNSATAILVNPQDYAQMILTKEATTGAYVYGTPNAVIPNVLGIPVISSNVIAVDKFLIGDFSKVTIGQRAGVSVRFYDQNEDDAIYNMVTVVIEERLTVVADRADRLIYGDFTDAMAALETA